MRLKSIFKIIIAVSVMTAGATFFSGVLLSKLMSPAEYGSYAYWQSVVSLLSNIIPYGTIAIVSVFRHSVSINVFWERLAYGIFIIVPSSAIIFGIVVFAFNELGFEIPLSFAYISILVVYFNSYFLIYTGLLRAEHFLNKYAIVMIFGSILLLVAQVAAWFVFENVEKIFITMVVVNACIAIFCIIKILDRNILNYFDIKKIYFSKIQWNLAYGFPIVLSSVAMSFLTVGDKILYKNYASNDDFGEYAKFTLIASVSMFMVNNFATAWGTFLSKNLSGMTVFQVRELFDKGSKNLSLGAAACLILLIPFIVLMFNMIYGWRSYYYLIPLCFLTAGYVLYGMSKFYIGFLMYYKKNYDILYATLIACGVLLLGFYLIEDHTQNMVSLLVAFSYFSYFLILKIICTKLMINQESNYVL